VRLSAQRAQHRVERADRLDLLAADLAPFVHVVGGLVEVVQLQRELVIAIAGGVAVGREMAEDRFEMGVLRIRARGEVRHSLSEILVARGHAGCWHRTRWLATLDASAPRTRAPETRKAGA